MAHRLQPFIAFLAIGFWVRSRKYHPLQTRKRGGLSAQVVRYWGGLVDYAILFRVRIKLCHKMGGLKWAAWDEISPILDAPVEFLTIKGKVSEHFDDIVRALRRMQSTAGHHSHPATCFNIVIEAAAGRPALLLRRDSDGRQEYWVYYPAFRATGVNDIGHVFVGSLDGS